MNNSKHRTEDLPVFIVSIFNVEMDEARSGLGSSVTELWPPSNICKHNANLMFRINFYVTGRGPLVL